MRGCWCWRGLEGEEGVKEGVVALYLGCGHGAAVEHGLPVGLECAQLGKGHGVYAVDRAAVAGLVKVREGAVEVCGRGCTGGCRGGLPPAARRAWSISSSEHAWPTVSIRSSLVMMPSASRSSTEKAVRSVGSPMA